jgi:hypothetical protein
LDEALEEETIFIAWELARLQRGLELVEQQALDLLLLSVLVHLRHGSKWITIRSEGGQLLFLNPAGELLAEIQPSPGIKGIKPTQVAELIE